MVNICAPPRTDPRRRRSAPSASGVSTTAATTNRADTAAPGVQPDSSRLAARAPEDPKAAAASRASPSPAPFRCFIGPPLYVIVKVSYSAYSVARCLKGVKVVFAHDTEVALAAAAALINT